MNSAEYRLYKGEIAKKVRTLRLSRHLTQDELSQALGLSQGRYSEIERGQGSFSAEQFLEILRIFNVPASHFSLEKTRPSEELQNALARLGASHLNENAGLLPSEQLEKVEDVVRETLLEAGSSRQITALAPVLVHNIARLNLNKLWARFVDYRLEHRFAWLVDNTLCAIREEIATKPPRKQAMALRKAEVVLADFLKRVGPGLLNTASEPIQDTLGATILSNKTKAEIAKASSDISEKWGILTNIQPEDFIQALRSSRDSN